MIANARIYYLIILAAILVACVAIWVTPSSAHHRQTRHCTGCRCFNAEHSSTRDHVTAQHDLTRTFITDQFTFHQSWVMNEYFLLTILPAMMMMTEQLVSTGMHQTLVIGSLLDAKHQLETQRLFQRKMAEAHKKYHPNVEMCTIGTTADSLAAAEQGGKTTAHILAQKSLNRQLLSLENNSATGPHEDRQGRLALFIERYCDENDNNQQLDDVCTSGSAPNETINKDIDYSGLVATPYTINADFTDGATDPNTDEIDIMALAANLFSHDTMEQIPQSVTPTANAQIAYMDMRSVVAKRSVAENSFYEIVGMKSSGSIESGQALQTKEYGQIILEQLGIPAAEADVLIGERPSYYALMQLIAKKIYQQPEFYTNLYDKPANVLRKDTAMRAIDLMVDRDIYKSELRQEAVLAVLLELELMKYQSDIQNRLNALDDATGANN
jgi:hypothetical protein